MTDKTQSFRLGPDGEVVKLEAFYDVNAEQHVVYWDDITLEFPTASQIKNGTTKVSFARNKERQWCHPPCIRLYPDVVLEIVPGDPAMLRPPAGEDAINTKPIYPAGCHSVKGSVSRLSIGSLALHNISTAIASPVSLATAVSTSAKTTSLAFTPPVSHRLLQRTQSMLQESSVQLVQYERTVQAGDIVQADAIMHSVHAMHQDLRGGMLALHSEVEKNKDLQQQMLDMQRTADVQAKRIIELQELSIKMHQEALDRLALIQNKVAAIMTQSYELHEYPIPRLFIVLPKEDTTMTEMLTRGIKNMFSKQFKLYFLCECGDHTKPADGRPTNPNLKHEIHIARHEGYDIDRPTEFFDKYGPYILTLLQMLKYGVAIAGIVVPPLGQLKIVESVKDVHESINNILKDIGPRVDSSIAYIEGLTGVQSHLSSTDPNSTSADSGTMDGLEALEGADLRQLDSFLKTSDEGRVLGNLYRTVTSKGHIKWVCLDHYRENYRSKAAQELRDAVQEVYGEYNEVTGSVTVELSSSIAARRLYSVLSSSRSVQQLDISFGWSPSRQDLRDLRDAIKMTTIFHVRLNGAFQDAPLSDLLNTNRRSDPILQMMSSSNIRSFYLDAWEGFLDRISKVPASLSVRSLRIQSDEKWSKRVSRAVSILQACPSLSELVLRVDGIKMVLDPIVAALEDGKRSQPTKLTMESKHSKASVEFEAHTGQPSSIDLSGPDVIRTDTFYHPSVRNLNLTGEYDLKTLLDLFSRLLKTNTRLESVQIDCSLENFGTWMAAFRELFVRFPQQTPRFCLWYGFGSASTSNIQDPTATKVYLKDIDIKQLAAGFLGTIPDSYSFTAKELQMGVGTTPSDVEALVQFCKRRSEQHLFATLCLFLEERSDPTIFPALLKALQECTALQDIDFQFYFIDIDTSNLFASPSSQDSVKRIVQGYTTFLSTSGHLLSDNNSTFYTTSAGPCQRLQKLYISAIHHQLTEQELSWILSIIKRNDISEPHRIDTDHNSADTSRDLIATTSPLSPNRLRQVCFSDTMLTEEQWMQLIQSIDLLTLEKVTVTRCSDFTEACLTALVSRCITIAADVLASRQPPTAPLDAWVLRDLQARELQHFCIGIYETAVNDEHIERETERLKAHSVEWVSIKNRWD
ncbi:hypothetical protein BGX23_003575 [Mortierella sp. AD031]|nr:hypothetical protein BGX23_003575 [Mortierella sp. AD031]